MTTQNEALRARSGSADSADPLVDFLYHLLRDHVPAGVVEDLMQNHVFPDKHPGAQVSEFCNGYIANYAKDVAGRLLGPRRVPSERIDTREFCPTELEELREAVNRQGLGTKLLLIRPEFLPTFLRNPDPAFIRETDRFVLSGGVVGYWHGIPVVQSAELMSTWFVA